MTTHVLTIDMITFSIYDVSGTEVAMPQRISPDRSEMSDTVMVRSSKRASKGNLSEGADAFIESVADIDSEDRAVFDRLVEWAREIVEMPGVNLFTYTGVNRDRITLLPRLATEKAGLVTIWNDNGKPYLSLWRTVFERRAPNSIESVEQVSDIRIGQGNTVSSDSQALLGALTAAYREATEN